MKCIIIIIIITVTITIIIIIIIVIIIIMITNSTGFSLSSQMKSLRHYPEILKYSYHDILIHLYPHISIGLSPSSTMMKSLLHRLLKSSASLSCN